MSRWHIAGVLYGTLCLAFIAAVWSSASLLPSPLATHFNGQGQADGWMTVGPYLRSVCGTGLGASLLIVGTFFAIRFMPASMVNLPNKEYWLSPSQRGETYNVLLGYGFVLGCLLLILFGCIHYLTILANRSHPPQTPPAQMIGLMIGFGLAMTIWSICLLLRFRRARIK